MATTPYPSVNPFAAPGSTSDPWTSYYNSSPMGAGTNSVPTLQLSHAGDTYDPSYRPPAPTPVTVAPLEDIPEWTGQQTAAQQAQDQLTYYQSLLPSLESWGAIQNQIAGNLSPSTIQNLELWGAERGVQQGLSDSPNANAATLRFLGQTTEQLQQQGIQNELSAYKAFPQLDPGAASRNSLEAFTSHAREEAANDRAFMQASTQAAMQAFQYTENMNLAEVNHRAQLALDAIQGDRQMSIENQRIAAQLVMAQWQIASQERIAAMRSSGSGGGSGGGSLPSRTSGSSSGNGINPAYAQAVNDAINRAQQARDRANQNPTASNVAAADQAQAEAQRIWNQASQNNPNRGTGSGAMYMGEETYNPFVDSSEFPTWADYNTSYWMDDTLGGSSSSSPLSTSQAYDLFSLGGGDADTLNWLNEQGFFADSGGGSSSLVSQSTIDNIYAQIAADQAANEQRALVRGASQVIGSASNPVGVNLSGGSFGTLFDDSPFGYYGDGTGLYVTAPNEANAPNTGWTWTPWNTSSNLMTGSISGIDWSNIAGTPAYNGPVAPASNGGGSWVLM